MSEKVTLGWRYLINDFLSKIYVKSTRIEEAVTTKVKGTVVYFSEILIMCVLEILNEILEDSKFNTFLFVRNRCL